MDPMPPGCLQWGDPEGSLYRQEINKRTGHSGDTLAWYLGSKFVTASLHVTPGVAGIWVIQTQANQVPYHGPYQVNLRLFFVFSARMGTPVPVGTVLYTTERWE